MAIKKDQTGTSVVKRTTKKTIKKVEQLLWDFPKQSLEEAIEITKAIDEKYAGNQVDADDVAKAIGYSKAEDWRFRELLKSANLYGIVEGSGAKATVKLTELGSSIVSPTSPTVRQKALLDSFLTVDQFKKVYEYYKGKKIPEDEYFKNTIIKNFGIQKERVEIFVKIFLSNIEYVKAFSGIGDTRQLLSDGSEKPSDEPVQVQSVEKSSIREFLDTCFILMPFGEWNDKYFETIYNPAIKDAGYEPLRADSLFASGSVIEQIWDQIIKAKVLLADLSGKNANVFYELGLSHAISKPIVFISNNIEDVPFDLRHLRVIIYDVREPNWGEELKKNITSFLKSTKTDPSKSIPQPFRK
jgi:hypothetical protein